MVKSRRIEVLFDNPLAIWKTWADNLRGFAVESDAQMAEESPGDLVAALIAFLGDPPDQAVPYQAQRT
jgi:haloacetate dehalogenase